MYGDVSSPLIARVLRRLVGWYHHDINQWTDSLADLSISPLWWYCLKNIHLIFFIVTFLKWQFHVTGCPVTISHGVLFPQELGTFAQPRHLSIQNITSLMSYARKVSFHSFNCCGVAYRMVAAFNTIDFCVNAEKWTFPLYRGSPLHDIVTKDNITINNIRSNILSTISQSMMILLKMTEGSTHWLISWWYQPTNRC